MTLYYQRVLSFPSTYLSHDFRGRKSGVGGASQGDNFPNKHPEAPNVRFDRKYVVIQRLRGHPANRESSFALPLVNVRGDDVPSEAKVRHFARVILRDQHVPGGQVPVNYLPKRKTLIKKLNLEKKMLCMLNEVFSADYSNSFE